MSFRYFMTLRIIRLFPLILLGMTLGVIIFGGWSDLRMVERYASFANDEHMQAAILKIA